MVLNGWSAKDIKTGIGGSEEKLIELSKELAKDYWVTIYHNGEHGLFDEVFYEDHSSFEPWEHVDVFISFKNREILKQSINADKIFHWTTEIENWNIPMNQDHIDKIICISDYHRSRMVGDSKKFITSYLWADFRKLDEVQNIEKEKGSMLYSSSFDRGLEDLLRSWSSVKEKLGVNTLYITYGWNYFDSMAKSRPEMYQWKAQMEKLMGQEGIKVLGRQSEEEMNKLYMKSEYWILPLNNPDSELFCINAIKAQYCGCKPVVRRIGALQETVNHFIDWDGLIGQKHSQDNFTVKSIENNKDFAMKFSIQKGIEEWKQMIG
jgi:glycosyltransferase involved in cell wall biosynthesis